MSKLVLVLDGDDVCYQRTDLLRCLINERLGTSLEYKDLTDYRFWVCFGLEREEMIKIRREVESTLDVASLEPVPGMREAYLALSAYYDFVIATARADQEYEATVEWHRRQGQDVEVVLTACPNPDCGNPACAVRENKLELSRRYGAVAFIDDHCGEFLEQGRRGAWEDAGITPICFPRPWNESCLEAGYPTLRLDWTEITKLLLAKVGVSISPGVSS